MLVGYKKPLRYDYGMAVTGMSVITTCMPSIPSRYYGSVAVEPNKEEEIVKKFFRQIFKDPVEHDLVEEYFDFTPTSLLLALFHRSEMIKTIRCIKAERIRKEDLDYENKVQMMDDSEKDGVDIESALGK